MMGRFFKDNIGRRLMAKDKTENIEMITGDPKRAIVKLALPMMFSMFILMLYNLVDSIWVAGLGADALAAIGFITPLYLILVGVVNGIGTGTNSLIARYIGSDNYNQANNAALHSLLIGAIVSVIFTIVILIFLKPILILFGAGNTLQYALDYGYMIFGLLFIFIFEEIGLAIFRSEGDMHHVTIVMTLAAILNMIFDSLFIYVLNFGIAGAALATVLSSVIACVILIYWILSKDLYLDLSFTNFDFQPSLIKENLFVALPSSIENLFFSILLVFINGMLLTVAGSSAVGVYLVSSKILQFAALPVFAIGSAVLTVSGIAYGAKNHENLKTAFSFSIRLSLAISVVLVIMIYFLSPQISLLFSYTEASVSLAPQIQYALSILCFFNLSIPLGAMSSMMFQGVGKGLHSLTITILRSVIVNSLFAYICCFVFGWGLKGIYVGLVIGSFIGGTIGYIMAKIFIKRFEKEVSEKNRLKTE